MYPVISFILRNLLNSDLRIWIWAIRFWRISDEFLLPGMAWALICLLLINCGTSLEYQAVFWIWTERHPFYTATAWSEPAVCSLWHILAAWMRYSDSLATPQTLLQRVSGARRRHRHTLPHRVRVWHCGRLTSVTNFAPSDDVLGEQLASWGNNLRLAWRLIIETNWWAS